MTPQVFVEVIVHLSMKAVDQAYHYSVPVSLQDRIQLGVRVLVPFGRRKIAGYVVGVGGAPEVTLVKDILEILDEEPAFTPELYQVASWMARRYLCTVSEALYAIATPGRTGAPRFREEVGPVHGDRDTSVGPCTPKQALVWETALRHPALTRTELAAQAGVSVSVVNRLIAHGMLQVTRRPVLRVPELVAEDPSPLPSLTETQDKAVRSIVAAFDHRGKDVFLLYGVTGSGKTEVYLRSTAECLARGRQALILVPEISLTGQMVARFVGRFGRQVAVLHSRLGTGERYDEWRRVFNGDAPVVLGTRSAVFAPLRRLGLIVLDEEHEPSYKQDDDPKYHARDVALYRAKEQGAVVVMGSATPSLRAYAQALKGEHCGLLKLPRRVDDRPMPAVTVVDLRLEHQSGNRTVFSKLLAHSIRDRLSRREQVILFLNRRGYATVVLCRECGHAMQCPHCAIALNYHQDDCLRCHYCGYQTKMPTKCPQCGGGYLGYLGMGTQRVEEGVRRLFPAARVMRLDSDTTTGKQAYERLLRDFSRGEYDILVGTQMVAKGLDLPEVTLVGVINADGSLLLPDYRACERTFQLLAQVAGRAGRGVKPGEVVLQTYSPDHYSIRAAAQHDYERFFLQEMAIRRQLNYPPFATMARMLFRSRDESKARAAANAFAKLISDSAITVLGPSEAPLTRIKDHYRWHIVCKASSRIDLVRVLQEATQMFANHNRWRVQVSVDLDPQVMI